MLAKGNVVREQPYDHRPSSDAVANTGTPRASKTAEAVASPFHLGGLLASDGIQPSRPPRGGLPRSNRLHQLSATHAHFALFRLRGVGEWWKNFEAAADHGRMLGLDFPHLAHPIGDFGHNERVELVRFHGDERRGAWFLRASSIACARRVSSWMKRSVQGDWWWTRFAYVWDSFTANLTLIRR